MSKLKNNQTIALFSLLSIGLCSCTRAKHNMGIDTGKYALIDLHLHLQKGLTQQKVVEAAISGLKDVISHTGMKANLILCCMRGQGNEEENLETVRLTKLYLNKQFANKGIKRG